MFGYNTLIKDKTGSKMSTLSELSSVYDPPRFVVPFPLHNRRFIQISRQQELGWNNIVSEEVAIG